MNRSTTAGVAQSIAKGWKPNQYLTNMSMAFFQKDEDFVANALFPICPVDLSTGYYYTFNKADLARDNVSKKPKFGKVTPAIMGQSDDTYKCEVDQVIVGIDQIGALDYSRSRAPGVADPRRAKVRFATEQMKLHMDIMFAENYFKAGVWANEYAGVASNPTGKQFLKFTDANFDPINFFDTLKRNIKQTGRRSPNKLGLGVDAFIALRNHPDIVERVKFTGSTLNPARVTTDVLAQLFGLDKVVVLESTYNKAEVGATEDMQFVCDSKSAILLYATDAPQIDEPSAGYTFTWDMLGNGQTVAMDQWEGEKGTHSEFIEGLCSYDMKKTSDDLAVFLTACV